MKTIKLFKIRKKGTELFSTGGSYPRWSKTGKTWAARAHVHNHMNVVGTASGPRNPCPYSTEAELVEYEVTILQVTDMAMAMATARQNAEERVRKAKEANQRRELDRQASKDRQEFERLKKLFPNG